MRFDQILQRLTPNANYSFDVIEQTILSRRPGDSKPIERTSEVPVYDDYEKIIWEDEQIVKPTLVECEAEWAVIENERANEDIDERRREAYGSIGDQLDMIYWDQVNSTSVWIDHITNVKQQYPKPQQ